LIALLFLSVLVGAKQILLNALDAGANPASVLSAREIHGPT